MRVKIIRCDLCEMEGLERTAVAMYRDATGTKWDVCQEHLELAKEAGLEYQMLALETNDAKGS